MHLNIHFSPRLSTKIAKEKQNQFLQTIESSNFGFFKLTEDHKHIQSCRSVSNQFKDRQHFVHIGIGGSALGPQMLIDALKSPSCTKQFHFIDNVDPDKISDQLAPLDPKNCLIYVVSKSGGTSETAAGMIIAMNWLDQHGIPPEEYKHYFAFCTGMTGTLSHLGEQLGISMLTVPDNIGGRFSVLSPVGLLPAIFASIQVEDIYAGAEELKKEILLDSPDNRFYHCADFLFQLSQKEQISQTVLMPYSSKFKKLSHWFVQLWAESLGKELKGLTPIAAVGTTDQHAQVQLFMQGPKDKCLFLIEVERFRNDLSMQNQIQADTCKKLAPYTMGKLLKANLHGTMQALEDEERPYIHLKIADHSAKSLGALILFFESLTVLMGHYLEVNPFNQPGVEAGKRHAFEWLSKNG